MRYTKDIVEDWLRHNDPGYGENKDYMNNDRFRWVRRKEIPSNPIKMDTLSVAGRCYF